MIRASLHRFHRSLPWLFTPPGKKLGRVTETGGQNNYLAASADRQEAMIDFLKKQAEAKAQRHEQQAQQMERAAEQQEQQQRDLRETMAAMAASVAQSAGGGPARGGSSQDELHPAVAAALAASAEAVAAALAASEARQAASEARTTAQFSDIMQLLRQENLGGAGSSGGAVGAAQPPPAAPERGTGEGLGPYRELQSLQ